MVTEPDLREEPGNRTPPTDGLTSTNPTVDNPAAAESTLRVSRSATRA